MMVTIMTSCNYRQLSVATNNTAENIIRNAIFRLAIQHRNEEDDKTTLQFLRLQKNIDKQAISLAANQLSTESPACRTILTPEFVQSNKVS
jgi:hypothetical protein